jgi:3-hydroxybutyryl-CoA dehydrogenase
MNEPIKRILIVGAGWTGRQIALQCAAHGVETHLADASEPTVDAALHWIDAHVGSIASEANWSPDAIKTYSKHLHRFPWNAKTDPTTVPSTNVEFDMVLECVSEQASIKRRVLSQISERFSSGTIICSNSSYFTPSILSKYVQAPERYAHFHFHAPIHLSTVVDVSCSPVTADDVAVRLCDLAKRIGQHPIRENRENPGYIYNWLLQSLITASLQLADREVATPEEIDFVWKTITRMPVGPFGIMDTIGLDLVQQVLSNGRWVGDHEAMQKLIDVLEPYVKSGDLGVKTGKGFFQYATHSGPTPIGLPVERHAHPEP